MHRNKNEHNAAEDERSRRYTKLSLDFYLQTTLGFVIVVRHLNFHTPIVRIVHMLLLQVPTPLKPPNIVCVLLIIHPIP